MQEFSFSELSRMVGQIVDAAMLRPVALTKHGRRKLVLLPASEYDRLVAAAGGEKGTQDPVPVAVSTKPLGRRLSALKGAYDEEV